MVKCRSLGMIGFLTALAIAGACSQGASPTGPAPAITGSGQNAKPSVGVTTITYSGQGLIADGFGGYDLITELCGVANGADVNGSYLLWVLTATDATSATITGPWGANAPMTKSGNGTFKYISGWYEPSTLVSFPVTATYNGKSNAQLTISHGCRPFTHGAWCSPGFWKNAESGAWTLIGVDQTTAMFNGNVSPNFYANNLSPDQLLTYVLNHPTDFGGTLGTAGPYGLTAFNAVGAYLTNLIPGYQYDDNARQTGNESDTCPIDHHGNFK